VLDLPAGLYSPGLARLCAQESVRGSFTDAADAVEYATGVRIGTRQIIELTRAAAADATAFYADPGREVSAAAPDDALVITADGKGVPVRPEALRPGTAKLATKAKTSATDDSSGSKPHRKRMAELVCVYDLTPVPRTVEDILPTLIGDGDGDGEGDGEGGADGGNEDGGDEDEDGDAPGGMLGGTIVSSSRWSTVGIDDTQSGQVVIRTLP
jgi:hypothetical protein